MHSPKRTTDRAAQLGAVFAEFDLDGSGTIESQELQTLGEVRRSLGQKKGSWTPERNKRFLSKVDTDGDGQISASEFISYFDLALGADEFDLVVAQFLAVARACRRRRLGSPDRSPSSSASPIGLSSPGSPSRPSLVEQVLSSPRSPRESSLQRRMARRFQGRTSGAERIYSGHMSSVLAMALSEEPRLLYTASQDGTARAFSLDSGETAVVFEGHSAAVSCLALHGCWLFTGSHDGTVRQWETSVGQSTQYPLRSLVAFDVDAPPAACAKPVTAVAVQHTRVVCATRDTNSRLVWFDVSPDSDNRRQTSRLKSGLSDANDTVSVLLSHQGVMIGASLCGEVFELGSARGGQVELTAKIGSHGDEVTCMTLGSSSSSGSVFTGGRDATIKQWCLARRKMLRSFVGHLSVVRGLHSVGPLCRWLRMRSVAGDRLLSGAADGTVRSWVTEDGSCQTTLDVREAAVTGVVAYGSKLYVACADGNVRAYMIQS